MEGEISSSKRLRKVRKELKKRCTQKKGKLELIEDSTATLSYEEPNLKDEVKTEFIDVCEDTEFQASRNEKITGVKISEDPLIKMEAEFPSSKRQKKDVEETPSCWAQNVKRELIEGSTPTFSFEEPNLKEEFHLEFIDVCADTVFQASRNEIQTGDVEIKEELPIQFELESESTLERIPKSTILAKVGNNLENLSKSSGKANADSSISASSSKSSVRDNSTLPLLTEYEISNLCDAIDSGESDQGSDSSDERSDSSDDEFCIESLEDQIADGAPPEFEKQFDDPQPDELGEQNVYEGRLLRHPAVAYPNWKKTSNYRPKSHVFDNRTGGIQRDTFTLNTDALKHEYFQFFMSSDCIELIVKETNKFYYFCEAQLLVVKSAHEKEWVDTNPSEMYTFLALFLLMQHIKKPHLKEYWKNCDLTGTPAFGKYMTRDRFLSLMRYLHFSDNSSPVEDDKIWKIRPVITLLLAKYNECFVPHQNLVIAESLILFKGRLVFKQYIKTKRHRFGIKIFVLCDCRTGIIMDVIVYTGSHEDISANDPHGCSGAVVKKMIAKFFGKGHILYTGNWYTSPSLSRFLLTQNTGSVGTVRINTKGMPHFDKNSIRGTSQVYSSENNLVALQWTDKRSVTFLTTEHTGQMVKTDKRDYRTGEAIRKPDVVQDYTKNMCLMDKVDMQVGSIDCHRKSHKWYKKLFFHFVDMTLLNSYNLYKLNTGKSISFREFSIDVIREILAKYGTLTTRSTAAPRSVANRLNAAATMSQHFLEPIPNNPDNSKPRRRCHVCGHSDRRPKKLTRVSTWCADCKVPLCMVPCFPEYHSLPRY